MKTTGSNIQLGTTVLYYNHWTGYKNEELRKLFRPATANDIRTLKACDVIWLEKDPLHPNGKVYGYMKTKVERIDGRRIYFNNGFTALHDNIHFVDDEDALSKLIDADRKMTDIIGDTGRAASTLLRGICGG